MTEKFKPFTPYSYCKSNPINRIDPDGKADYKVNSRGQIVPLNKEQQSKKAWESKTDRVVKTNILGKVKYDKKTGDLKNRKFVEIKQGSLNVIRTDNLKGKDGKSYTTTVYEFGNDKESATKLYNFLAENTNVEWAKVTTAPKGGNEYVNLHTSNKSKVVAVSARRSGYDNGTMKDHDHSHPNRFNPTPSPYDLGVKNEYEKDYPGQSEFSIRHKGEDYKY